MRRVLLGGVITAASVLAGCTAADDDDQLLAHEVTCGYDDQTLLPAMASAVADDATVRMSMEMSGLGHHVTMDAVIAYAPSGAEIDMTTNSDGDEFALVLADDRVFISDATTGGAYEEVDSSDPAYLRWRDLAEGADVASFFAAWNAGLTSVEHVGVVEIDGESVCQYSLLVDSAAAAGTKGNLLPPEAPEMITFEVYLTVDDLMRRVTFDLPGLRTEMNATHWNDPVDIEAPTG